MSAGAGPQAGGAFWWLKPWCWQGGLRAQDRRNSRAASSWSAVWGVCFIGVNAMLTFLAPPSPLAWALAALPLAPGFFALRAHLRFLREADELVRMIHLQSLGAGAGAAMAVGTTFMTIIPLGASPVWGLALALTALCLGYSFGVARATRMLRG